ncbi:MAG: carboxypeptidase-like regulatory domain-containing protein [Planctomycetota bacterium]|jgi:hypothetical protein
MSIRTANLGRTSMWVPTALLLLVVAMAWVLSSGEDTGDAPGETHGLSGIDSGTVPETLTPGKLDPSLTPPDRVEVVPTPTHGKIRGRVVAENWVTWPSGITLSLAPQEGGDPLQTLGASKEFPQFAFERVPLGNYRLSLTAPDCVKQNLLVSVTAQQVDQFMAVPLSPAASIRGTVVDRTGHPIASIPVAATLYSTAPGRSQVPYTASTDEDGNFHITGLRDGEFEVYVGTFRNPLSEVKIVGIHRGAPEAWVNFVVDAMGSATVQVDFLDGAEVAAEDWRTMRVQAVLSAESKGFSESMPLNAEGRVVFPALPPGEYSFVAYGGPYRRVSRKASVSPDLPAQVTIPMRRYKP